MIKNRIIFWILPLLIGCAKNDVQFCISKNNILSISDSSYFFTDFTYHNQCKDLYIHDSLIKKGELLKIVNFVDIIKNFGIKELKINDSFLIHINATSPTKYKSVNATISFKFNKEQCVQTVSPW